MIGFIGKVGASSAADTAHTVAAKAGNVQDELTEFLKIVKSPVNVGGG